MQIGAPKKEPTRWPRKYVSVEDRAAIAKHEAPGNQVRSGLCKYNYQLRIDGEPSPASVITQELSLDILVAFDLHSATQDDYTNAYQELGRIGLRGADQMGRPYPNTTLLGHLAVGSVTEAQELIVRTLKKATGNKRCRVIAAAWIDCRYSLDWQ